MERKVVITGLGTVNPVGNSTEETWNNLLAGRSGIARIASFDPEAVGTRTKIAGEVRGIDPAEILGAKDARKMDRFSQLGIIASLEAWEDAGIELNDELAEGIGTLIASGVGGIATVVEQGFNVRDRGPGRVNPFTVPMLMPNAAAGLVAMRLGLFGPSMSTASACASAADAIGVAFDMVRSGRARAMLAGGAEAGIQPLCIAGFDQARALCSTSNDDPESASRPFDLNRSGFVLSEGGAILMLEDEELARSRGARIIAELAGYGVASDGYHITAPEPEGRGGRRAVRTALATASATADDVVYVNAHGTSTQLNDKVESLVIRRELYSDGRRVPVSSTKSMSGHLGGSAGALEAVICAKVAEAGTAPQTINYDTPDPECDIEVIADSPREVGDGVILSNSFGFGGHCTTLAFRPYSG
jgi:3-oxoacyl-[acyl-carrier-protein] synthase II